MYGDRWMNGIIVMLLCVGGAFAVGVWELIKYIVS
jgi:hypothetical protein